MGLYKTDPSCIKQREYCNIESWMNKYTGKGMNIMHIDVDKTHAEVCIDMMETILPDAKFYRVGLTSLSKNNEIYECKVDCKTTNENIPFDDFVKKYKINGINNSTSGKSKTIAPIAKYMQKKIVEYNLFCTGSAGNTEEHQNNFRGAFVLVTGVYLKNGKPVKATPPKEAADFTNFMGFQSGTSFSAPVIQAMGQLVRCKYGINLTQAQIYQYLKDHCQDLGTTGKDSQYGWGIPILGDINEKYNFEDKEGEENMKYLDVKETDWFYEAVEYVTEKGYMKGMGNDNFEPNQSLTRAQVAQILLNVDKIKGDI